MEAAGYPFKWDLLNRPWNVLGDWTKLGAGTSEIVSGQLHQLPVGSPYFVGRYKMVAGGFPEKWTWETKLKIVAWGWWDGNLHDGIHQPKLRIKQNQIGLWSQGSNFEYIDTENNDGWNIWRMLIDSQTATVKVYKNGSFLHEFTNPFKSSGYDGEISAAMVQSGGLGESYEEYIRVANGLHKPSIFTPDLSPQTYGPIKTEGAPWGDLEHPMHILYVCPVCSYHSVQLPVEVKLR